MMFRSDSQRRAVFANMGNSNMFARKPSKKMVSDLVKGLNEPVTDFEQVVPNPRAVRVERVKSEVTGLANVRERPKNIVSEVESFPEHGSGFFPIRNYGGSADAAKADAKRMAEVLDGGNARAWVDPVWTGSNLVGYTVRLKNVETDEELLDKDTRVVEGFE